MGPSSWTAGAIGAIVSTVVAVASVGIDTLPAASLIVAVTVKAVPNTGAGTFTVVLPAAISAATNACSISFTVTVSPTTAFAGKPTIISTLLSASISFSVISLSPLPIATVGASGTMVSRTAFATTAGET